MRRPGVEQDIHLDMLKRNKSVTRTLQNIRTAEEMYAKFWKERAGKDVTRDYTQPIKPEAMPNMRKWLEAMDYRTMKISESYWVILGSSNVPIFSGKTEDEAILRAFYDGDDE